MSMPPKPSLGPIANGGPGPMFKPEPYIPVHSSYESGVHTNRQCGSEDVHIPFVGQTTLPTFGIGGEKGLENDRMLAKLGGTLKSPLWYPDRG